MAILVFITTVTVKTNHGPFSDIQVYDMVILAIVGY